MAKPSVPIADRFWPRVQGGSVDDCWEWTGPKSNGYGKIGIGERGAGEVRTHRLAYELLRAEIPEGLQIDHLCRNRGCCNPWHLEPVPQSVNLRRAGDAKTHCPHGHELPPPTDRIGGRRRQCRTCDHIRYVKTRREQGYEVRDEQ